MEEFTPAPAKPRRLVGRLLPWMIALGLFAGGGYGVYTYAVPQAQQLGATADALAADPFAAKPGVTADEQIKQLFSSSSPAASAAPTSVPEPSYRDRYAMVPAPTSQAVPEPHLPPAQEPDRDEVATPRSAASLAPSTAPPMQNPFATTPVADRYSAPTVTETAPVEAPAAATEAAATPEVEPTAHAEPIQSAAAIAPMEAQEEPQTPAEITRGQEPVSENPLRSGARAAQTSPAARDAFGRSASSTTPPKSVDVASTAPVAAAGSSTGSATPTPASAGPRGGPGRYFGSAAAQAFATPNSPTPAAADAYADAEPTPAEPTAAAAQVSPFTAATPIPMGQQAPNYSAEVQPPAPAALMADNAGVTPTPGLASIDGAGRPGERILEGLQNPAIAIQKLAPPEIQVGKKCTIAIRLQNTSKQSAHNVQIRDEVPFGTQLVGTAPKANVAGPQVTWDLGTLSPGDERIVEMELMPTEEGELGSVATVSFSAQASAKVRCTRPQLALRLTAAPRVMIGDQHVVQIEVANPGTGDATGVMLLETVPAGVSHEAGPALEFEVGTLKPGQSKQLDLVLTAEQAGRITNAMTARADANLEVEAVCEFEVIAPDLKVSVDGPKQRYLERPATYTVSIANPGTASAKDVQLITQLPPGLKFVSANNMGEYDAATHSVHWSLAELPANERGAVELTALPVETGEHTLQVASRAEQGLEDRTEARVNVEGLVALSFEVSAVAGALEVGGETFYDVTVVNQGTKAAANVQVVAAMPEGLRALSGQGATRAVVEGDKLVFAPLAQLAPKAEAKYRVQVQGLRPGDLRAQISVTADEVQDPITKEQSTHVYADQ